MAHHAGTTKVTCSGKTRNEALLRCCAAVRDATGEDAYTDYSGYAPHWLLVDVTCQVVMLAPANAEDDTVAGVDVEATFEWRDHR